jgi:hypothetical protein
MTEPAVSFAGNLTDDPELRHTENGIVRSPLGISRSIDRRRLDPTAGGALLPAPAAFAVPAPFGVAQPLPAVPSNSAQQGLGHGGLLGQELFRLDEGNSEGNDPGQDPGSVVALLGRGHAVQLRKELLAIPPAMLRWKGQGSRADHQAGPPGGLARLAGPPGTSAGRSWFFT